MGRENGWKSFSVKGCAIVAAKSLLFRIVRHGYINAICIMSKVTGQNTFVRINVSANGTKRGNIMLKFFKMVRSERADIETLQLRIKELQMSLLPSGIRYDKDKVQTSPSDQMLEIAAKVDDLERKMQSKLAKLNADMVKAMTIVQAMPTPEYRQLLTLRYLTGRMSWEQIAEVMGYSVDHVKGYLHKMSIDESNKVNTQ